MISVPPLPSGLRPCGDASVSAIDPPWSPRGGPRHLRLLAKHDEYLPCVIDLGRGRGPAWLGRQCKEHLAAAVCVEAMREIEKQEKKRVGPGTIPAYVRRADTSADEHKPVGLRGGCGTLCSSAT
jgi:hypothetical protein